MATDLKPTLLLAILLFTGLGSAATSWGYAPPTSFIAYADRMDAKYFPVFLRSFEILKKGDVDRLHEYFHEDIFRANTSRQRVSFESNGSAPSDIIYHDTYALFPQGYPVRFPVQWRANPKNDLSWSFDFQSLVWLDDYLSKGERGDYASAAKAFRVMSDWIRANPAWPTDNPLMYDEHCCVLRLEAFYRALRIYQKSPYRDDEFLNQLLCGILNHLSLLATEELFHWHNRMIIVDSRLIKILDGFYELKGRDELLKLAVERFSEELRAEYSPEGVHNEHSSCYHIYVNSALVELVDYLKKKGDAPADLVELQERSADFYAYILKPDGSWPDFGDCSDGGKYVMTGTLGEDYFRRHPEVRYALTSGREGRRPLHPIRVFPQSGYAVFRDVWPAKTYAAVKSEFHSDAHYHEDETSFVLSAFGHDLIVDPGIYSYNRDPFGSYMRSSAAHNILAVDDRDFERDWGMVGLAGITRFHVAADETSGMVELTHPHYEKIEVGVFRQFGQLAPGSYVVRDLHESKTTRVYSQLFHLAPGASVRKTGQNTFAVSWKGYPYVLWFRSVFDSFDVIEGAIAPIQGWYFPSYGVKTAAPVLKLDRVGDSGSFETLIALLPEGTAPEWEKLARQSSELSESLAAHPRRSLQREVSPPELTPPRKRNKTSGR